MNLFTAPNQTNGVHHSDHQTVAYIRGMQDRAIRVAAHLKVGCKCEYMCDFPLIINNALSNYSFNCLSHCSSVLPNMRRSGHHLPDDCRMYLRHAGSSDQGSRAS